ncbi:VOC family protein [Cytobacillus sp. FSL R5-0569]|uniref:VOC family protein n=1 Tax=Cytobacillus TaxID=2675230 RepID=UPI002784037D|nr:VOC family protein [Cytobacillus kochii]MDQ0185247.1 putative enzyme related to lactoylglutathione lyase [Cytobacillus kochii]
MSRLVHFEIHVDDMDRARKFYGEVFGWTFEDWSEFAGMPYFGAVTGGEDEPGINGALMQRQSPPPESNQPLNGYACTIGVENYHEIEGKILNNGGVVALPKYALPGMAWQGYYKDTEGNIFGIHQPDANAK